MVRDSFVSDAGAFLCAGSIFLVFTLLNAFQKEFSPLSIILPLAAGMLFFVAGVSLTLSARKPMKPPIEKQEAKPSLTASHWAERKIGERYAVYLARLEELKASGKIDEKTYQKLAEEYARKLREAIEVPIQPVQA